MNTVKTVRRAAVVAAVLFCGAAFAGASVPDEGGRFTGCVHRQTGVLRVIDTAKKQACGSQEYRISWNERGPQGPAGIAGPPGPPGPPGSYTAVEQFNGLSCRAGSGVLAVVNGPGDAISFRCDVVAEPPPPTDCGALIAFDPRLTPGYDDYPINGETADNQYRSFLRGEFVTSVKGAADQVVRVAADSPTGHGAPIGLGDMSECDGSIPGTSNGDPGHPPGTHTDGLDIDIAYYQTGTPDNHLRSVCETAVNRVEQNHCVAPPDRLDTYRTALFVEALASSASVRVIGVDGQIGPLLEDMLARLCADGVTDCTPVPLTYETTDTGQGWFYFQHHHMHVSFARPR